MASRIGDDSNLTLDPDLDTFYLQDVVVVKVPTLLSQLSEAQTLLREAAAEPSAVHNIRILILDGFLQSTADGIEANLAAAYRGNTDGKLKRAVQANIAEMISGTSSYLSRVKEIMAAGEVKTADTASFERGATSAMRSAIDAWTVTQAELDRLLRQRIDGLLDKLWRSLMVISMAGCLSILIAFMTHQHIVRPLARLENMARTVRETKNYNLRADISSQDEIGQLAAAFNDMLAELAEARKREVADQARTAAMQSELARATRLTTMGEMEASIAHEINQPLGAIAAQGNAGLRWLKRQTPDLHEVEQTLEHIVSDGHRASQIISGIRTMFKKDGRSKTRLDINDLIREVLALVDREVENQRAFVRTDLIEELPQVLVDRVQMQQVILNLIMNAFDAMESLNDRARVLQLKSEKHEPSGVLVTVEDSGAGIEKENMDRIFEAFFTTKSRGMGMGLAICGSIVEGHGGRLTASRGYPHGTVF